MTEYFDSLKAGRITQSSGWVILDKPSGMSSHAAGGRVARLFGVKKFGHLGTLDPMASGVLPIALGEATKMIPFIPPHRGGAARPGPRRNRKISVGGRMRGEGGSESEKEYIFSIEWGFETDTLDSTGKTIRRDDRRPSYDEIVAACEKFLGDIDQVPPAYSAVHIGGRRAYELARKGAEVSLPARRVRIDDLFLYFGGPFDAMEDSTFIVKCGAGTYVRALARDIGTAAGGSLATVDMIRRTRTHGFTIKDAKSLDFLENLVHNSPHEVQNYLHPVDFGLDDILVTELNQNDGMRFKHGNFIEIAVSREQAAGKATNSVRRVYSENQFVGIGEIQENVLKPKRIINNG